MAVPDDRAKTATNLPGNGDRSGHDARSHSAGKDRRKVLILAASVGTAQIGSRIIDLELNVNSEAKPQETQWARHGQKCKPPINAMLASNCQIMGAGGGVAGRRMANTNEGSRSLGRENLKHGGAPKSRSRRLFQKLPKSVRTLRDQFPARTSIPSGSGWHKSPFNSSPGNSAKLGSKYFEHRKLAEKNLKTTSIFGFKAYSKNLRAQRQRCCTLFCTLVMTVAENAEFCSYQKLERCKVLPQDPRSRCKVPFASVFDQSLAFKPGFEQWDRAAASRPLKDLGNPNYRYLGKS
ncbi:hypothetical protein K438DRAFT_1767548 [Mycena galopus ATCC 62051]|nr:hypothetical protein K438DRAFT_1767548 [Mycena galopus ATCC 62051]